MTPDEIIKLFKAVHPLNLKAGDMYAAATMIEQLQENCRKWQKMAEGLIHVPRLVSYAPDGSTCTLNIDGEEHYYDRVASTNAEACLPSISEEEKDFLLRTIEPMNEFDSAIEGAKTYEALVKDAERYRFLKAQHKDPEGDFWVEQHGVLSIAYLDEAIDKAMGES